MLIEVKELENCRVNIKFEADAGQVEDKRNEIIKQLKTGKVAGFRKGKATTEAVKLKFKNTINEFLKEEMARYAFTTAIAEKNIKPFGQPQFTAINLDGSKFDCDFFVNKIPNVELEQYKNFEIPNPNIPSAAEMSQKILQELRVRNGEMLPFGENDFAQDGDSIILNYEVFSNTDESLLVKEGDLLVLGKSVIPNFDDNILGMRIGEKREFLTDVPVDNAFVQLAGKECKFVVELIMGSKSIPAELNDKLANKVGVNNINELLSMTESIANKRVNELREKSLTEQVSNRLVASHNFDVPDWLSTFEAQLLVRQYGSTWDKLADQDKENFVQIAAKNVKLSIILDKIREVEAEAQLSDEEAFNLVKSNIEKYKATMPQLLDKSDDEIMNAIVSSGYLNALMSTVRDDFTINFILKNSTIVE